MYITVDKKNIIRNIFDIVAALLFVFAFSNHFFANDLNGINSVVHIFVFFVAVLIRKKAATINENIKLSYLFGTIYSLIYVFGCSQYWNLSITNFYYPVSNLLRNVLYIVGFSVIVSDLFRIVAKKLADYNGSVVELVDTRKKIGLFALTQGIMFLAWIPCFLALYPGIFAYDLPEQTEQVVLNTITRHHPPLHTLIWKVFLEIEKVTPLSALAAFSIVQMLLVSFTLTYLVFYLIKRRTPLLVVIFSLLFFIVNPIVAIISMLTTKDIFFAICLIFTVIYIERVFLRNEKDKKNIAVLSIFVLLSALFRNNGVYALIVAMIALFVFFYKQWKIILTTFLLPIVLYFIISGPFYSALGFLEGTPKEKICIPMQQIASVVALKEDALSAEEVEQISKFFFYDGIKSWYNPRFADPVKMLLNDEYYNSHKVEFLKLWLKLFKENPICYVDAFLNQGIPYWYQDANTRDSYSSRQYLEVDIMERSLYPLERKSKLPGLANFYYSVAGYYSIEDKPLWVNLNSMATPLWVLFFAFFVTLWKKKYRAGVPILLLFALWLTYIIGPVCCFRYLIPIYLLYPYLLSMILDKD